MRLIFSVAVIYVSLLAFAVCDDTPYAGGQDRTAFVQLFEWSWVDIEKECVDFLGPHGFDAVQISPPNDHKEGDQWWTRYQPVSYKLVSRSGNLEEFSSMVKTCKSVGVKIYADCVVNHMASGSGRGISGSQYWDRNFPGTWASQNFHHEGNGQGNCGVSNYQDRYNVQHCDLVGLPDLDTSSVTYRKTVSKYIKEMENLGVAGIRIDASKHIDANELGKMLELTNSSMFRVQEVISGYGEAIAAEEYVKNGHVTDFDYQRTIAGAFKDKNLWNLKDLSKVSKLPSANAVVFIDNHDTQRGAPTLTYKDGDLYKLATMFMLTHPFGYPRIMSSYAFDNNDNGPPAHNNGGWVKEHRFPGVVDMVRFRNVVNGLPMKNFELNKDNNQLLTFNRGDLSFVMLTFNEFNGEVQTNLAAGVYCDLAVYTKMSKCVQYTVDDGGRTTININKAAMVVLLSKDIILGD